jgi:hypothetical protein
LFDQFIDIPRTEGARLRSWGIPLREDRCDSSVASFEDDEKVPQALDSIEDSVDQTDSSSGAQQGTEKKGFFGRMLQKRRENKAEKEKTASSDGSQNRFSFFAVSLSHQLFFRSLCILYFIVYTNM